MPRSRSAIAGFAALPAQAGFRSPESLIRNVYAYYGKGSAELSKGLPHNAETAEQFFDRSLRSAWVAPRNQPYDFLVQSENWKLGPVAIAILRKQFDKTYVDRQLRQQRPRRDAELHRRQRTRTAG